MCTATMEEFRTPRPVTARCIDIGASWGALGVLSAILFWLC